LPSLGVTSPSQYIAVHPGLQGDFELIPIKS
jgi:hypothetical protein